MSDLQLVVASMSHIRYWQPVTCSSAGPAVPQLQLELNSHLLETTLSSTGATESCSL